jgi:uncharacterized cupredoxin-like copper-binding protein
VVRVVLDDASGARRRWMRTTLRSVLGLIAIGGLLVSCSSGPAAGPISSTLKEWQITLSSTNIKAGDVTFNFKNDGDKDHEFVVVKTELAGDALPTKDTGEVDENGTGFEAIGEKEDILAASSDLSLTLNLTPGHYVAFCNVYAEDLSHYAKGMHTEFTVQ